jgi:hypothetical protein
MTDDPRIRELQTNVAKLGELLQTAVNLFDRERTQRAEMCLTVTRLVVSLKNHQCAQGRLIAKSPLFGDETDRQELLHQISMIESECEQLEKILSDAGDSGSPAVPGQDG